MFPNDLIRKIGCNLIFLIYLGRADISGDDWANAFADAVGGKHLSAPLGVADVELGKNCWSLKTVKTKNPLKDTSVRLISGRCSPDYSYQIENPHENPQRTGDAVLSIWNERINIATDYYSSVRTAVLVRSYDMLTYSIFEQDTQRYRVTDYVWEANKNGNLVGYDANKKPCFTWQPHGSQFTIHTEVPEKRAMFQIRKPPILQKTDFLKSVNFDDSWITILD